MKNIAESIKEIEEKSKTIEITTEDLADFIDHTELSPYATENSLNGLCNEAKNFGFYSVCVHPFYAQFCAKKLEGTGVSTDVVVGFPLGQTTSEEKAFETEKAIEAGASEIDMVMNIGAFKDERYDLVKEDIEAVVNASRENTVKVIIETSYLTYEEITRACELVKEAGADFVKNGTGFGPYGANVPHIFFMRRAVGEDFGVKAAGGISDSRDALRMIAAGANRIGTSSGVKIIESHKEENPKNWRVEENPCPLCPSEMISPGEVPDDVYQYYKSKCESCE